MIKTRVSEACLVLLGSQGTVTGNNYFMFGLVMVTLGKSRCASGATPRRDKDCARQETTRLPLMVAAMFTSDLFGTIILQEMDTTSCLG